MEKKNGHNWIYWIVLLVGLYIASLYFVGYEHLVNPTEPLWMVITNLTLISVLSSCYMDLSVYSNGTATKRKFRKNQPLSFTFPLLHTANSRNINDSFRRVICFGRLWWY